MSNAKQSVLQDANPTIKLILEPSMMERLKKGPLAATDGRGAASYVRCLLTQALERYEAIEAGRTQIDPAFFRAQQGGQ